jgi:hypothetical protein
MPILSAQVSMVEQGKAKSIMGKWVQNIASMGLVNSSILSELLGAEHENPLVARLEDLHDRQCLERFPQTHAISQDAAVMRQDLVDDPP